MWNDAMQTDEQLADVSMEWLKKYFSLAMEKIFIKDTNWNYVWSIGSVESIDDIAEALCSIAYQELMSVELSQRENIKRSGQFQRLKDRFIKTLSLYL